MLQNHNEILNYIYIDKSQGIMFSNWGKKTMKRVKRKVTILFSLLNKQAKKKMYKKGFRIKIMMCTMNTSLTFIHGYYLPSHILSMVKVNKHIVVLLLLLIILVVKKMGSLLHLTNTINTCLTTAAAVTFVYIRDILISFWKWVFSSSSLFYHHTIIVYFIVIYIISLLYNIFFLHKTI